MKPILICIIIFMCCLCKNKPTEVQINDQSEFMPSAYNDLIHTIPIKVSDFIKDSLYIIVETTDNTKFQKLSIINGSNEEFIIEILDNGYPCVLQAKNKNGEWKPIEYWLWNECGNKFYSIIDTFPPKTMRKIKLEKHKKGNFETLLRYQLLAEGKLYYSNEFVGKIKIKDFLEDTTTYISPRTGLRTIRNKSISLDSISSYYYKRRR